MIFYIGESSNGRTAAGAKSRLKLGDRLMVGLHPLKVAMNVRIVLPQPVGKMQVCRRNLAARSASLG